MKTDPIIAVKDVEQSSEWYQSVFGWKSAHGGDEFEILISDKKEVMLCLHKWGTHEHPTMLKPSTQSGSGLILYHRTADMKIIRETLRKMEYSIEAEVAKNPNSQMEEFSLKDPDGYSWIVSEFHEYGIE